ncbi:hypothetical protein ES708_01102 [subsurface metagenome]
MINLGDKVKDTITDFEGTAHEWLSQVGKSWKKKDF